MTLKRILERWDPTGGKKKFTLKSVTENDILKMISKIKSSHAFRRDKVDTAVVKLAAPILVPIITHIVNLSLGTLSFPVKWKLSRIIPLLLVSKLTERVVQLQILNFLEVTNQLSANHHAYRDRHSTLTMLIQLMDTIASATDMNRITASMSLDLSAAFDCIVHETLIMKLEYYGIDGDTIKWIR